MPTNVSRNFCLFEIPVDHLMFSWLWPEVNNAMVIKSGRLSSRCPTLSQWLLPMAVWPPCTLSCQLRVCPWTCSNPWGCAPTSWSSLCPSSPCSSCTASPANNEELSHKRLPWYQPLGQVGRVANRVVGNDSFGRTAPCRHCRRHQRLLLKHKKKKSSYSWSSPASICRTSPCRSCPWTRGRAVPADQEGCQGLPPPACGGTRPPSENIIRIGRALALSFCLGVS